MRKKKKKGGSKGRGGGGEKKKVSQVRWHRTVLPATQELEGEWSVQGQPEKGSIRLSIKI